MIFICMFDPFEKNLPIYTFSNRCKEMPDLELGDDTTKVFVNPYGDTKDLAEEIKAFFEFLKNELTQSDLTKKLYEEVEKARENKEWRREYMAWISELEESKEEARAEGREEGRKEGRKEGREEGRKEGREEGRKEGREEGREESREQIAISMLKDNMPISKVILYSSLSESRILELQQNLTEN